MEEELIRAVFALLLIVVLKQQLDNGVLLMLHHLRRRRQMEYRREEAEDQAVARQRLQVVEQLLWFSPLPYPVRNAREQWMKVRSKEWWNRIVLTEFTDLEWRENFRMTRASFVKLCGLVQDFMSPEEVCVREPIPLNMRVAIVLYRLGSCAEYRLIANQFGVHKATVKKFTYLFCKGMVEGGLLKTLIRMPNEEEALEIAAGFEASHNIPQIFGLIDGTHIPILPPSDGYRDFVNRKGWPSYVLQAVVDDRFTFRSISCKMPGCAHDSLVLQNSDLYRNAHLLPQVTRRIEGEDIKLQIVGDPAYPLLDWLIKGYPASPNLTPEQASFNIYLSSVRVGVEQTFGLLKSRFRVLQKRSDFHYTFAPKMIATCCGLHNFCQQERDQGNVNWLEDTGSQYPQPIHAANRDCVLNNTRARDALTKYMARNFPLRTGSYNGH